MRSINSFAAAVHRLRRAHGMSLGDVAAETSYSSSYLSKMLHGRRRLLPAVVSEIDHALHADGELERIARAQDTDGATLVRPMQLPPAAADFVGREGYLHQMDQALVAQEHPGATVTVVIEGGFWSGKTELALQWAARIQKRFPGGCLFADLRGLAPGAAADPGDVLDAFLRALGGGTDVLPGSVEDRAARYRSLLAQRPAVVVLDNIASYEQVQHLLPGTGSALLVTSREHQPALLLRSSGLHIDLPPLTRDEALVLLRRRLGDARVNVDLVAAEAIVHRSGRLPMAVLIAAEHIQQRRQGSLRHLADTLAIESRRLTLFSSPDPAVNVHAVIDLSYLALPPRAARVFRLLGVCPAYLVSVESTAALTGLTTAEARDALDLLRHAHLIEDTAAGRMRMNDLLRAYAHQRAVAEEPRSELDRAHNRILRWYVTAARAASDALVPGWSGTGPTSDDITGVVPRTLIEHDYDAAMDWFDAEAETAIHIARHVRKSAAVDAGWLLSTFFLPYFYLTKNRGAWLTAASEGLAAAREVGSHVGIACCQQSLGWVLHELGRTEEGIEHLRQATHLHTQIGDDRARAWSTFGLAVAHAALDRHTDAREGYLLAEALFASVGLDLGVVVTRAMLSSTYQALGNTDQANSFAHDALSRAQKLTSKPVISLAHHRVGLVLLHKHQHRMAMIHFDAALALRRISRERWGEAETLIARAETQSNLGDTDGARESYHDAVAIFEALRDPRALEIHARIATSMPAHGPEPTTDRPDTLLCSRVS